MIHGMEVVTTSDRITRKQGFAQRIKVEDGPKIISKDNDQEAYWNHAELGFGRPVRTSDNALVKPFNSRFRQECLFEHWFLSTVDARAKISSWQIEYNTKGPHSPISFMRNGTGGGSIHSITPPVSRTPKPL